MCDHDDFTNGDSAGVSLTPIAFSSTSSGDNHIQLTVEPTISDPGELIKKYKLEKCCQWINDNNFQRISLQFPDELLVDAAAITSWLGENVSGQVFILGDTSYGSCCVDEVAAQHYNADSIIHFGYACLNPTKRLPVFFIFDEQALDVADCCDKFYNCFPDHESNVIIYYDVRYSYAIGELQTYLESYKNVVITELDIPQNDRKSDCDSKVQHFSKCRRLFTIPESESIEDYSIYFIGEPENTLIDSKEFYQPVVTPFEVEMALNPAREWTGDYYTDFTLLLPGAACYVPLPDEPFDNTDVSLITGKIRTLGEDAEHPESSNVILIRPDALSVTTVNAKTAGEFLTQRSWQGLEQNLGETPITKAVEGDAGIAWSYTHEMLPSEKD
ncbi:DPH2 [Acanthosepion pharaonis]|uniref:DPH2 n=1 Tax=Acanthosepion pharaonis TaxID=158019 RepID=A0A812BQB4_ACAPH|nr:DPH2 [Sepia pharaonis]